jgi:hypothetical protein
MARLPKSGCAAGQARRAGLAAALSLLVFSGCTTIFAPVDAVPAHRLPFEFLGEPRANLVTIDLALLRQDPPENYLLDTNDTVAVYVKGVLPPPGGAGQPEQPPPVYFPQEEDSPLPPVIGYPMVVREDGTLSIPELGNIPVRGLTMIQAENAIRKKGLELGVLKPGNDRVTLMLLRKRTYQVVVVREDSGSGATGSESGSGRSSGRGGGGRGGATEQLRRGSGSLVNLPAYQNDVLHALAATGGLPGLDAKNEVKILRGKYKDAAQRLAMMRALREGCTLDPCVCPPPPPDDPSVIRIPLRLPPGMDPQLRPADVILEDGDILFVEARDTEVFYTGGLLQGGEYPLPRDYDLDVLGAIAIAGGSIGSSPRGGGGGGGGSGGGGLGLIGTVPPSQLIIIRKTPCGGQVTIEVDLVRAVNNPRDRILVQPGDTLLLRHKCEEEVANFSLVAFFTYGLRELFGGGGGGGGR